MKTELIEVSVAKEYASTFLADPIFILGVNAVLNNTPRFNLVFCGNCKCSDDSGCPKKKVWCNKMCRYMNEDGFCSEGDNKNETN